MPERSKAFKYFLIGVKIDVLLVLSLCLVLLVWWIVGFDGRCPNLFEASTSSCSLLEYLKLSFGLTLIVTVFVFWWAVIPTLLTPPLLGLIIGYYKSHKLE